MIDHNKLGAPACLLKGQQVAGRFELTDDVIVLMHKRTKGFSKGKIYGLTSQMRKSAVSVPVEFMCQGIAE